MIGAIIQARMNSERLPGKVLREVQGKPMLGYLLERLGRCRSLDTLVVATSREGSDTPIWDFCAQQGILCHRGPLDDVATRFKEAVEHFQLDAFVRISGDSPLLDQRLVDQAVEISVREGVDLVTNVLVRTYPKGQSVEVLTAEAFARAFPLIAEAEEREHVTRYFYTHPNAFRIFNLISPRELGGIQLSVDTAQDLDIFASIISSLKRPHWDYSFGEILEIREAVLSRERAAGKGTSDLPSGYDRDSKMTTWNKKG